MYYLNIQNFLKKIKLTSYCVKQVLSKSEKQKRKNPGRERERESEIQRQKHKAIKQHLKRQTNTNNKTIPSPSNP